MAYRICWHCKQELKPGESGHYVPPSLGEPGFYICEKPKVNEN